MPRIFFKKLFVAAIREGSKTTTIRLWKSCSIAPGDRAFSPNVGWLLIKACDRIELHDLNEADARADGFASLNELHQVLRRLYPGRATDGRQWYRIIFALEESSAPKPARPRRRTKTPHNPSAKHRLADRIRLELDKAVRASGSLLPL